MGADFLLYSLPAAEITPTRERQLRKIVDRLTDTDLLKLADGNTTDLTAEELADVVTPVRDQLRAAIEELRTAHLSRETCVVQFDGMPYPLLLTGGLSWGDDPTEIGRMFRVLSGCPPILDRLTAWAAADAGKGAAEIAAAPAVVLLSSEAFGDESFRYETLDTALAGIRRLFTVCERAFATDGIPRRISLCVGPPNEVEE